MKKMKLSEQWGLHEKPGYKQCVGLPAHLTVYLVSQVQSHSSDVNVNRAAEHLCILLIITQLRPNVG